MVNNKISESPYTVVYDFFKQSFEPGVFAVRWLLIEPF